MDETNIGHGKSELINPELKNKIYISKKTHERLENKSNTGFASGSLRSDPRGTYILVSDDVFKHIKEEAEFQDWTMEEAMNFLLDRAEANEAAID